MCEARAEAMRSLSLSKGPALIMPSVSKIMSEANKVESRRSHVEEQKKGEKISPFSFVISPFMITLARVLTLRDRRKAYP